MVDGDFGLDPPKEGELYGVHKWLSEVDDKTRSSLTGMDVAVLLREAYDIDYNIIDHNKTAPESLSHSIMVGKEDVFESSHYMMELMLFSQLELGKLINGSWLDYLELSYTETNWLKQKGQVLFNAKVKAQSNVERDLGR